MLDEFLFILSQSKKTQLFLALAVFAPLGILLLGAHMAEGLQFSGPLAPYTDFFREKILHRYDKGALAVFILMAGAAIKSYRKARRRLL